MTSGAEAVDVACKVARGWGVRVKNIDPKEVLVLGTSENFHGFISGVWPLMEPAAGWKGSSAKCRIRSRGRFAQRESLVSNRFVRDRLCYSERQHDQHQPEDGQGSSLYARRGLCRNLCTDASAHCCCYTGAAPWACQVGPRTFASFPSEVPHDNQRKNWGQKKRERKY